MLDFVCPAGKAQAFLWDTEAPGLGVRVTPKAKAGGKRGKSFIFQSRFEGATARMTIGDADIWPLSNRMDRLGPGRGRNSCNQVRARKPANCRAALIPAVIRGLWPRRTLRNVCTPGGIK